MKLFIFLTITCLAKIAAAVSNKIESPEEQTYESTTTEPTTGMRPTLARCRTVGRDRTKPAMEPAPMEPAPMEPAPMEPAPMEPAMVPGTIMTTAETTQSGGICKKRTNTGNSAEPNGCGFYQCVLQPDGTFKPLYQPCHAPLCYNFDKDKCDWK